MAVTRNSRSIVFGAQGDAITGPIYVNDITVVVAAGNAGDSIKITETSGAVIFDGVVEVADQNVSVPATFPQWVDGIILETAPSGFQRMVVRYL